MAVDDEKGCDIQYLGQRHVIKTMKVLLLGASGLLGHNVLRRLLDGGHAVRVLVRRKDGIHLPDEGWQTVVGNLTDDRTLLAAAEGVEAIINCAGVTDMSLLHRSDYEAVNSRLCTRLLDVMKYHGIRCLVHVSTANTIGFGTPGKPATEEAPMQEPFLSSYYADTKRVGETILQDAARHNPEWRLVIVNPGYMIGPMDVKPSSGRMLLLGYRKRLMFAPRGGKAFVDVRDVAQAVVNALVQGRSGERYIAVNRHGCLAISELYKMQARVMGYRQCIVTLPNWMLRLAGALGDGLRWLGIPTELATRNVRQLMVREYYDNGHAISDLNMPQTPIEQAIADFYRWREQKQ